MLITVSRFSNAAEIPLDKVPPLFQLTVFQSETDPNHYLILGKDGIYADAGNWYVLNWQNGKMTSPTLKPESYFYFGGGFDFKFESGEWLYIPGGNSGRGAPGATLEVIPPGLIDPNRGREPLRTVSVNDKLIEQLGISKMVSPDYQKELGKRAATEAPKKPIAPKEEIVIFIVNYDRKDSNDKDLTRALRDKLQESDERAIEVTDKMGMDSSTLYIWAFESQAKAIQGWVQNELHKTPVIKRGIVEISGGSKPVTDIHAFFKLESIERLQSAIATFEDLERNVSKLNPEQSEKAAVDLAYLLQAVEHALDLNSRVAYALDRWENSEAAKAKLAKNFTEPMRHLLSRGYGILDKMQTPLARKILLFNGKEAVARIQFLNRSSGVGSETYFQNWLNLLKEKIEWVKSASPQEQKDMRVNNSGGGILSEFGFVSVDVKDYSSKEQKPPYNLDEAKNMFPLRIFGLVDSPVYRSDLVRFVVEMDKAAEYQRVNFPTQYDGKIMGSLTLLNVLNGLTYAPGYKFDTREVPGFSRALYFKQVMMIVSELLNTSRITITNSATYLSLLNTAVSLQKAVTEEFGTVPNARSKSAELNGLTEQLLLLHQAVQVRMVRGVFNDPAHRAEECAAVLRAL